MANIKKKGQYRKKRKDTLIRNIEKKYNVDFGVRSDMELGTYLEKQGVPSLSKLIKKSQKRRGKRK